MNIYIYICVNINIYNYYIFLFVEHPQKMNVHGPAQHTSLIWECRLRRPPGPTPRCTDTTTIQTCICTLVSFTFKYIKTDTHTHTRLYAHVLTHGHVKRADAHMAYPHTQHFAGVVQPRTTISTNTRAPPFKVFYRENK